MKALFLLHLPPPIHGSSIVGKQILDSKKIQSHFNIRIINLLASEAIESTGKFQIFKIVLFIKITNSLLVELLFRRPNICYFALSTTGYSFFRDFILVSILKMFKVRIVFHLHNKGILKNEKNWPNYLLYKSVFNNSQVILLSKYLYNDIQRYIKKDQIHICPNGVPDVNIFPVVKVKPTILFLSNYIRSKGVLDLIDAAYILASRGVKFQVNLIGCEGNINREELNSIISNKGLGSNFNIKGPQYGSLKYEALANASFFVFPTWNDCFPLVLLEAMQTKLPIISTFEGGIPDIVEDGVTGFLVPQRDIDALADRMEQLIINPELCQQMGAAGRKRYEELFTAEIFENRLVEILKEVSLKYI